MNKLFIILLLAIGPSTIALSHSGDGDNHGCYKDIKSGRLHCH